MPCRVFYVDDHEDIVWSTAKLLERERSGLTVDGFTEPVAALAALTRNPPDLLITDLRMEGMSGLELMVAARKVVSDLPVIVVTAYGGPDVTAELAGRSLVEYLEKPVRTERLIASIDRLLARSEGFSGSILLPMLPDLIQIYTLSLTTGALEIRRGGNSGTLWFDGGQIVHAVCGEQAGEEAVYELLSWQGGEFSLHRKARPPERTIAASWQEVLLEGCRLLDEANRDLGLSAQGVAPVHDAAAIQSGSTGKAPRPIAVEEALAQLAMVDGFVGAAVLDAAALSLKGVEGRTSAIDLEVAVNGNAEVLAAIQSTLPDLDSEESVSDIVITLREQWHLIRPVKRRESVSLYLVIGRMEGNLVLARLRLAEVERQLRG